MKQRKQGILFTFRALEATTKVGEFGMVFNILREMADGDGEGVFGDEDLGNIEFDAFIKLPGAGTVRHWDAHGEGGLAALQKVPSAPFDGIEIEIWAFGLEDTSQIDAYHNRLMDLVENFLDGKQILTTRQTAMYSGVPSSGNSIN